MEPPLSPAFRPPLPLPGGPPPNCISPPSHTSNLMRQAAQRSSLVAVSDATSIYVYRTAKAIYVTRPATKVQRSMYPKPDTYSTPPEIVIPPNLIPQEVRPDRIPKMVKLLEKSFQNHYGEHWKTVKDNSLMKTLFQTGRVVRYTIWTKCDQTCTSRQKAQRQSGTTANGTPPERSTGATIIHAIRSVPQHSTESAPPQQ